MNDKTLYLHKLTNQRKRFEKWDIAEEYKKEYLDLIDKHIAIEREKSQDKKENYAVENVLCEKDCSMKSRMCNCAFVPYPY